MKRERVLATRFPRFLPAHKVVTCVAALFVLVSIAQAQVQTATVSGTATDSSGAALAGARVEARNLATNSSQSTATDSSGRYTMAELSIGTYDIQATLSGFQTVVHQGVSLTIGANLVVDFSLPVGNVTQTVNVEGQVSRVETETAAISSLVSSAQVADLPLNGRNYTQLVELAPGALYIPPGRGFPGAASFYGRQTDFSVGGSRPEGQAYLIDNEDVRDFWEHGPGSPATGTALGVEGIAEFQVLTNTYSAQFSGNGLAINSATKSGSNDLHGSVYEFFRNSALDSRNFFDNSYTVAPATVSTPSVITGVTANPKPEFRQNQFGGSVGGPIKKDKLFFFFNYEGFRNFQEQTLAQTNLPEPYVALGELPCSAQIAPDPVNAACPPSAYPPPGTPPPPAGSAGNPILSIPGGLGSGAGVPADAQAEILGVLGLYSRVPNYAAAAATAPDNGGFFPYSPRATQGNTQPENYYLGRVDYNISEKDALFGRYISDRSTQTVPYPASELTIGSTSPWPETDKSANQYFTLQERHIVSPTIVNSVRGIFTRTFSSSATGLLVGGSTSNVPVCTAGNCPDPLQFVARGPFPNNFPEGNIAACGACGIIGANGSLPQQFVQTKYGGGDDIVWTHGAHSFKVGVAITRVLTNLNAPFDLGGTPGFANLIVPTNPEENFLIGQAWSYVGTFPGHGDAVRHFKETDYAPYFEDDWKVSSKLTLNLGIRYDYATNPTGGPFAALLNAPFPDQRTYSQFCCTATGASYSNGFTPVTHVFQSNINALNFEPRIGVAYDPFGDHKTSIRAGFGIFYDQVAPRTYGSAYYFAPPYASEFNFDLSGFVPLPFPNPFPGVPSGAPVQQGEISGVDYLSKSAPYQMQYNLTIQRQLGAGTVLTVGYVGSEGRHLFIDRDYNPPECNTPGTAPGSAPTADPAICGSLNPLPTFNATVLGSPNPAVSQVVNPVLAAAPTPSCNAANPLLAITGIYPACTDFFTRLDEESPFGTSNYNSAQVVLNHQFSHGFQGQASYTYSKCLTTGSATSGLEPVGTSGSYLNDPYNRKYDYGICAFDLRHSLVVNGLYNLPFKGNRLVEGWEITTILRVSTGFPVNVTTGTNTDALGNGGEAQRPNFSGTCGAHGQVIGKWYEWFNQNCYNVAPTGGLGNVPINSIAGPGALNLDMSIIKNTKIFERLNTQFRAEFFNVLNHTDFASPGGVVPLGTPGGCFGGSGCAGGIVAATTPNNQREIQFALKLLF
jgi:Carboxypeptidase regulatory-like domain/TonB dependent receptor